MQLRGGTRPTATIVGLLAAVGLIMPAAVGLIMPAAVGLIMPAGAAASTNALWSINGVPSPAVAPPTGPGASAPVVAGQALAPAGDLASETDAGASQITAEPACSASPAGDARCAAQVLVLSASDALVHAQPAAGAPVQMLGADGRSSADTLPAASAAGEATAATNPADGDAPTESAPAESPPAESPPAESAPGPGTPGYLQQAYDLSYLSQSGGVGDTVAIVDAYDDDEAESDLDVFRSTYGLPACTTANGCFEKVNENGQNSPLPVTDGGWDIEITLDLDAVSSLCPNCHILLVEADTASYGDLATAEATAAKLGANQISNSWGGTDGSQESAFSFPGVAVVAAAGDSGYNTPGNDSYPAAYPGVNAAGGTTLTETFGAAARGFSETAWSLSRGDGGGSGCDLSEPKPSYQTDTGCTGRAYADLSADADPATGLLVYAVGLDGWAGVGGTSLATPLIAAYYAVTGASASSPGWAYANSALLNDPTSGSVGTCAAAISYICNAGVGYDGPTGAGSIFGDVVSGGPGIAGPSNAQSSFAMAGYAESVTASTATLQASVYPNGLDTTYYWQYGTTTGYGQSTPPVDIGGGITPVSFTTTLTGLSAGTYHYRLVAQNSLGTTYGFDYALATPGAPPVNLVLPHIVDESFEQTGQTHAGDLLAGVPGQWSPPQALWCMPDTLYTCQWQRNTGSGFKDIAGADNETYYSQAADRGAMLRIVVTATNAFGQATAVSSAVGPVLSGAPVNLDVPLLDPASVPVSPQEGDALNLRWVGVWAPLGTSYAVQWQRSKGSAFANIQGAATSFNPESTSFLSTYTLGSADLGASVRVAVTASNPFGRATAYSQVIGPVLSSPPTNTTAPSVSGTPQRNVEMTVSDGFWSPSQAAYKYTIQWQYSSTAGQSWSNISGATSASYKPTRSLEGDLLRANVTAVYAYGKASAASSATTAVAVNLPTNTAPPTISGTAQRASKLTVKSVGSWTGTGITYTYQWERSSDGSSWIGIAGATKTSYTIGVADEQDELRIQVSAHNVDGAVSASSAPTANVQPFAPVNTVLPKLSGSAKQGSVMKTSKGSWTGPGNTYTYQWQNSPDASNWTDIAGATSASYTVQATDEGDAVRAQVTATNPDGSVAASSAPSGTVPTPATAAGTRAPTAGGGG